MINQLFQSYKKYPLGWILNHTSLILWLVFVSNRIQYSMRLALLVFIYDHASSILSNLPLLRFNNLHF